MPPLASLVPHVGAMCLLDHVVSWDADTILCAATSHLRADNPLRRAGRLGIVCAAEYAMQAAAAHGTLTAGTRQGAGLVAALRALRFGAPRLDDPAHGALAVHAHLQRSSTAGFVYALLVRSEDGRDLLTGTATVILPADNPA